jgi:hypothetical protein
MKSWLQRFVVKFSHRATVMPGRRSPPFPEDGAGGFTVRFDGKPKAQ